MSDILMDVYDQRFNNLKRLIKIHGSQRKLADLVETNPSYISQILTKVEANGRPRTVGNDFARKIEEKLGLQHGWMDSSHDQQETALLQVDSPVAKHGQQSLHIPLPTDTTAASIPVRSIPVVSWVQAGNWTPICPITDAEITEWLPWYPHCGKNGFALIVSGESMLPKFE
ncbi:MAG: helix-turn-helix domain-containing protein, partial [Flavobacteriales bacterium]